MSVPAVLVIGATGKIGSALVERLLPDQASGRLKLSAAIRRPEASRHFEERGLEARQVDLDATETQGLGPLVSAMRGIERVFLLTGYDVKMLAQSKAVIDAAMVAGVAHVVHVGVHASRDTTIVHFAWHRMVETYIEKSELSYTHLHPTSFMQNLLMRGGAFSAKPGVITHFIAGARPSWIDTDDIAAVAAVVLREPAAHAGRTYPLGTEAASMDEIAALASEITGVPWRYQPQEPDVFFRLTTAAGADPVYMACVRTVFERTRNGSLPELSDTFDTVERLTGRAPTSLRAFFEKHRAAFSYSTTDPAR